MSLSPIPAAMAATSSASPQAESLQFILFIVVFGLFFYFILWRPQAKRAKEQRDLLNRLAVGDEVITTGGLLGKINKLNDDFITLNIADNVDIVVQKGAVAGTLPKGTMKNL